MPKTRVVTIGVKLEETSLSNVEFSLQELARLVDTAGGIVVKSFLQKRDKFTPKFLIGQGKLEEIKNFCDENDISTIVFDDALTPAQQKNLEKFLEIKVIDRTRLILDIFADHSSSKEGKLQVELAELEYVLPRLTGKGITLSQQSGGSGSIRAKGPGERKLEVDSRKVRDKITYLKNEIKNLSKSRVIQKNKRKDRDIPVIALVGYTNSGKSTLMNKLSNADVLMQDKLFATLDPKVSKLKLKNGLHVLLTDTVGFIQKLPHELVSAFKSTLDQIKDADLILHVIDSSLQNYELQKKAVYNVLDEIGVKNIPMLEIYNKIDLFDNDSKKTWLKRKDVIAISAKTSLGFDRLYKEIVNILKKNMKSVKISVPYKNSNLLHLFYEKGIVESVKHNEDKILVKAKLDEKTVNEIKKLIGE
jgi:GTPase